MLKCQQVKDMGAKAAFTCLRLHMRPQVKPRSARLHALKVLGALGSEFKLK